MSESKAKKLPPGWIMATIEDLFWPLEDGRTLHQGWSPQCEKTPAPTDADWGVLKTTALQAGTFLPQYNKALPKHLVPRPQTEVKMGDILITCAGPRVRCGIACLVRQTRPRLMMSGKMYRFRVSPDFFDARYLEAYLLTPEATAAINKMKTGGSDSGLNLTHDRFRPLPVPVAPLREQQRIMDAIEEIISDLDAGVSVLERLQTKLKIYRAAVLKAAVEGRLTAEWRARNPGTEPATVLQSRILTERRHRWEKAQLQKFKDAGKEPPVNWKNKYKEPAAPNSDKMATLPNGWCWVRLDQLLFEIEAGKSFTCEPRRAGSDEWGIIKVSAMSWGAFDETENKAIPSARKIDPYYEIKPGDLLLSRANTFELVGASVLVNACRPRLLLSDKSMRLLYSQQLDKVWMKTVLSSPVIRRQISQKSTGTKEGMRNVSQESVLDVIIPLAPAAECLAIVEAVEDQLSVIDHLETDLEAKLKSAQGLRQSVLRHAFTGQIVPQNPKDEPAAELLKRMAAEREEIIRQAKGAKQEKPRNKALRKNSTRKFKTPNLKVANA